MPGFLREAVSGRNPFVLRVSVIAALGGFLFGYDTGVISGAQLHIQRDLGTGTVVRSWIVGCLLRSAVAALGSAVAQRTGELIVARGVLGLAVGTASFVAPMYIAEHTRPGTGVARCRSTS
jgi:MFS family permease